MSRSYKKTPYFSDKKGKIKKRIANKTVRASLKERENKETSLQGGQFKKLYCSWNISDYNSRCTWEEWWELEWKHYFWQSRTCPNVEWKKPDKKKSYRQWRRCFYNK